MSSFTPLVKFEVQFENDTIIMNLRRLKRKAMMKLTPYMTKDGDGALDEIELMNVSADMLPEHVVDFKGLFTKNGMVITIEEMCEEAFFITLQADIVGEIFKISSLQEDDAKNSHRQPSTLPEVQDSPEEIVLPDTPVKIGPSVSKPVVTDKAPSSGAGPTVKATPNKST